MAATDPRRVVEVVWRIESARIVAGLARIVRDVGLAEELAQDTLVIALEQWPETGVPEHPASWLMATAKHRAIDALRRQNRHQQKLDEIGRATPAAAQPDIAAAVDGYVGDDLLRLIFTTCHPVLAIESGVALTLQLLGGLTTEEIARAFLVSEATVGQRIDTPPSHTARRRRSGRSRCRWSRGCARSTSARPGGVCAGAAREPVRSAGTRGS